MVDEARLDAAIEALTDRERFREAESVVAAAAPKLQRVLAQALEDGGWFGEAHEEEVRKAATEPDEPVTFAPPRANSKRSVPMPQPTSSNRWPSKSLKPITAGIHGAYS